MKRQHDNAPFSRNEPRARDRHQTCGSRANAGCASDHGGSGGAATAGAAPVGRRLDGRNACVRNEVQESGGPRDERTATVGVAGARDPGRVDDVDGRDQLRCSGRERLRKRGSIAASDRPRSAAGWRGCRWRRSAWREPSGRRQTRTPGRPCRRASAGGNAVAPMSSATSSPARRRPTGRNLESIGAFSVAASGDAGQAGRRMWHDLSPRVLHSSDRRRRRRRRPVGAIRPRPWRIAPRPCTRPSRSSTGTTTTPGRCARRVRAAI